MRTTANAKITVRNTEANPYDANASPALVEIRLTETFSGDIEGESPVRALQVLRDDKSACLVSMQRFRGKLSGREGTFVLQGSERVRRDVGLLVRVIARALKLRSSRTGTASRVHGAARRRAPARPAHR